MKTIFIGSDHAGFEKKEKIIKQLQTKDLTMIDCGTFSSASCDYPDYAHEVSKRVLSNPTSRGILLCGSGNGIAITANKHQQIRAALCWNHEIAVLARQHNDANVLCIPARYVDDEQLFKIVDTFLHTTFEGGRHAQRVQKINL